MNINDKIEKLAQLEQLAFRKYKEAKILAKTLEKEAISYPLSDKRKALLLKAHYLVRAAFKEWMTANDEYVYHLFYLL